MPRVVVLGTGTAVGKTYVTCAVARLLHRRLPDAAILCLKPIETGMSEGAAARARSDAAALEAATFNAVGPRPHPLYAFSNPVSPHRAAQADGKCIDVALIRSWLTKSDMTLHDTIWTFVETAGGVFSPLAPQITNLDLADALGPAVWLLVAPDALGVLHDLTATLQAMRSVAREPDVIVLSAARELDESTGGNLDEAVELGIATPVAALAPGDPAAAHAVVDALLAHA